MLLLMSSGLILVLTQKEDKHYSTGEDGVSVYSRQAQDRRVLLLLLLNYVIPGNSIWRADLSLGVTPIIYLLF